MFKKVYEKFPFAISWRENETLQTPDTKNNIYDCDLENGNITISAYDEKYYVNFNYLRFVYLKLKHFSGIFWL